MDNSFGSVDTDKNLTTLYNGIKRMLVSLTYLVVIKFLNYSLSIIKN